MAETKKKKNRILKLIAYVLSIAAILSLVPFTVSAATVASGECGDDLTWVLDDEGTLTISGEGEMKNGYWANYMGDEYRYSVESIVIESGVTSIGDGAFYRCSVLKSIIIPNSVTSIGNSAFRGCSVLESVVIPSSVTSIGDDAFSNCSTLESIVISDSVMSIGNSAFANCSTLESIVIPNSATSLGGSMFYGCSALESVVIPDSVTSLGDTMFYGCSALESIVIPDSVTSIGVGAFFNCGALKIIAVGKNNEFYHSDGNCLIATSSKELIRGCSNSVIPANGSVTNIGDGAFSNCSALESIVIPDSVISIGEEAFRRCSALESIIIPNNVTNISYRVFQDCNALKSAVIPDNITNIDSYAFCSCSALESIVIPNSVSFIDYCAFYECNNLKTIYYRGTAEEWKTIEIHLDNDCLKNADIVFNASHTHTFGEWTVTKSATTKDEGVQTRICTVCGETETQAIPKLPLIKNPFTDISSAEYYYNPVLWAVENGITNGTSPTTFSPEDTCTRGQIVTFLWRAAGSPEPTSQNNVFTDVKADDYYYKAVLWAVENGITNGTTKTTFDPDGSCTRAQAVTFLWRYEDEEQINADNIFTDVPAYEYYTNAVLWAVENKITNGTTNTTFEPNTFCTRGHIVTFLYRDIAE